jgi:hypothetical protein
MPVVENEHLMPKSHLWLFVGLGLLLIVVSLVLASLLPAPSVVPTPTLTLTPTTVSSSTRMIVATWDVSKLPKVTAPAPPPQGSQYAL